MLPNSHIFRGLYYFLHRKSLKFRMLIIHEAKWYGVWESESRKTEFAEPGFVLEQQDFADELKKLDFYNFVRKGELVEDTEEHYSSGSGRLVWLDYVLPYGEYKPMPILTYDESVFDLPEPD